MMVSETPVVRLLSQGRSLRRKLIGIKKMGVMR